MIMNYDHEYGTDDDDQYDVILCGGGGRDYYEYAYYW